MKRIATIVFVLMMSLTFSNVTPTAAQPLAGPSGAQAASPELVEVGGCLTGTWETVAPVNTARSRTGLAYLEATGKFYLAGGETTGGDRDIPIEVYDPVADTWSNMTNLLTGISNSGAVGVGQYVYIPGGYTGTVASADLQRFDPLANTVTTLAPLPGENHAHAVTVQDGKIYVLGGSPTGAAGFTNYIYDISTDTWTTGADLLLARQYPAAASDGTYIYVLGGNTSNEPQVQRYDPVTDSWDLIDDMAAGRGGPGAFYDGWNVWVVGGGWSSYLDSTEYWDGSNWIPGPSMNVGARTVGAAFGGGIALKAAGWQAGYQDAAEKLEFTCYAMELTSGDTALSGGQGETLTYTVTISNTGPTDDTYTLGVLFDTWLTLLETPMVSVASGSSASVEVYVTIPGNANDGDMDTATITVASNNNPAVADSLVITSTMTAIYGVDLTTENAALSGDRGATLNYTVTISNTGNVTDVYQVEVSGATWVTVLGSNLVEVAPGGSQTVAVTVTVPVTATTGDMSVATLTAVSTSSGDASDSLVLTSTAAVGSYFINLPLIVKN